MIRTLLALTLFATSACTGVDGNTPDYEEPTGADSQLIALLETLPDATLTASATFDGSDADVEFDYMGQSVQQPLTGIGSISVSLVDGAILLSGFDAIIDDFSVELQAPSFPTALVDISGAVLQLADRLEDGTMAPAPVISIAPSGSAQVTPAMAGQAQVTTELFGVFNVNSIEALQDPVIAFFEIGSEEIAISVDYDYTMNVELVITIPMTFHIHLDMTVPRPDSL